jgi:single-stranded-DNA-specific exonuclease
MILKKPWDFISLNKLAVDELANKSQIPHIIAKFLYQRGINTPEAVAQHFRLTLSSLSDPWKMADMDKAVDRLLKAIARHERVGVFGDYDVDGVTSAALIYKFLKQLGLEVTVYIPHREKEGYGLSAAGLKCCESQGCKLLITVDCGISNSEEVCLARRLMMDVIITDHHEPSNCLPQAIAVLNPKRSDCLFPFKELAGVGVAFNLIRALRHRLYELGHWNVDQVPNLKEYLDFVALGTVADAVPLLGDNRILVRSGLEVINRCERPGIKAIKALCYLNSDITSSDIAFRVGPLINAAGRMAHANKAFELLTTDSEVKANQLATELHLLNQQRQTEEKSMFTEALDKIQSLVEEYPSYVLSSPKWKKGILGIVAARLVDQFHKPVILFTLDGKEAHGSGRCPPGINLYESLRACSIHLSSFGGHKAAAGLRLSCDSIKKFTEDFQKFMASSLDQNQVRPMLMLDCIACIEELVDPGFAKFYEYLEPFGAGYLAPVFAVRDFEVHRSRVVGNGHLKLTLTSRNSQNHYIKRKVDLLGWGHGDKVNLPWESLELACTPFINVWQGQKQLELKLRDIRYR